MSIQYRRANHADSSIIYRFICDLALFELEPDAVQTSEAIISNQLNQEHPPFFCELVLVDDEPAGMALCYYSYSTWTGKRSIHLEDLYIAPQYRNRGLAKGLIHRLIEYAKSEDCARLDWSVLYWNRPAIQLYEKIGAKPLKEWIGYRMGQDEMDFFNKNF